MAQLDQASGRYEQSRSPLIPQLDINAHQDYLTVNLAGLGFTCARRNGKSWTFRVHGCAIFHEMGIAQSWQHPGLAEFPGTAGILPPTGGQCA